jgi:acyl-CoA synthetase (AMP-forming)/AMP-acid ligase II
MFGNGLRPQIWTQFVTRFNIKQIGEFYGATEGNSNIGGLSHLIFFVILIENKFDITVNFDNTVGAVGFVPRYAGIVYPVALIKCNEETGEPTRGPDGLCIRCKPGKKLVATTWIKIIIKGEHIKIEPTFRRVWRFCGKNQQKAGSECVPWIC